MIVLERLLFVLAFIVTIPLLILWFMIPTVIGIVILPIAAVKFVLTGKSGIDWYVDKIWSGCMKWPIFLWDDSLRRRGHVP